MHWLADYLLQWNPSDVKSSELRVDLPPGEVHLIQNEAAE